MSALGGRAAFQIHPERSAIQRVLDVVHRERVPRAEHIDVAALDQLLQMLGRAGMHHRRPRHEQRLPAFGARAFEFARRLADDRALRLLDARCRW